MESHLGQAGVSDNLSGVLDGIFMASKVSTGFRKTLAFRAVEVSWREHGCVGRQSSVDGGCEVIPEESVPQLVEQIGQAEVAMKFLVEAVQPVLVERIEDRIADQMVDISVSAVMDETVAVAQEVAWSQSSMSAGCRAGEDRRVYCGCASSSALARSRRGGEVGPT